MKHKKKKCKWGKKPQQPTMVSRNRGILTFKGLNYMSHSHTHTQTRTQTNLELGVIGHTALSRSSVSQRGVRTFMDMHVRELGAFF